VQQADYSALSGQRQEIRVIWCGYRRMCAIFAGSPTLSANGATYTSMGRSPMKAIEETQRA